MINVRTLFYKHVVAAFPLINPKNGEMGSFR